ncbi:precorrin-3B C(17)-methyltransferase [Paramaledivibacter caminithermalis]|jgi:precorrin-3B C17-methyltransferase|uniref:Cobalt-precorrin 3 C17-methyltransferase n=1 Tax=Paramaledivibacter caminithermalis (strain DSM 15212 / CIP 107654 / DViRD3) TaxID=1121301 RepID=A0A1M6ML82_PARC5|nr:precorrin-3B C(17)-methyltransferase [Paramaledivibacter caminithermalis]SHJ84184.1 cobalt-precorrin 3 C17-methyltransferase [Paramaledivibacter caminithermalis DSM 15212]
MNNNGKIYVVGIGPGNREQMSLLALRAIKESDVIVGYKTYINIIEDLTEGKEVINSGMKKEIERCDITIDEAEKGKVVSIISSGDPGVYGMAGVILELVAKRNSDIEVEVVPGITAANAAAASLGAPLMHDYAVISLSDLLTDWEVIKRRIDCAAAGDFIITLYNPRSKGRVTQIEEAREIIMQYRKPTTPVGIVRNAKREGEEVFITNLENMLKHKIDMFTMVIIGNTNTYKLNDKMITPRGYFK